MSFEKEGGMILLYATTIDDEIDTPALVATDKASWDAVMKVFGKTLAVETKQARSPEQHRMYFAVLNFVYQNQEQFKSAEDLREATLMDIGHSRLRERLDGSRYRVAKSVSFHNLGHEKFQEIFDKSIDLWCQHFGHDPEVLLQARNAV